MGSLFGRVAALRALLCGPRFQCLLVRPSSGGPPWPQERTLVAVKPDGVQRRLVGTVIQRFERRGFKLVGMKMLQAPESILAEHYRDLQRKPFYPALISYMSSGPVVAMVQQGRGNGMGLWGVILRAKERAWIEPRAPRVPSFSRTPISVLQVWEGPNVVHISRAMIGHTDSTEAAPGTIRGDFSVHISSACRSQKRVLDAWSQSYRNVIHASDSVDGAQREIELWFQSSELLNWADGGHHSSCYPA